MASEVYIDVPIGKNISKILGVVAQVLHGVNKALEAIQNGLKAASFIGVPGAAAAEKFVGVIRPYIEKMAKKCEELSDDVAKAVENYITGDESIVSRFSA